MKMKKIEPKTKIKIVDYALIIVIVLLLVSVFIMYNGKLTGKVVSDESYSNLSVEFKMNNSANSDFLAFKSIEPRDNYIFINYTFNNSNFIGNGVSIDVWIVNEKGNEIKRVQDIFSIKKNGLIERGVWFELGSENPGVYSVYLALSEDTGQKSSDFSPVSSSPEQKSEGLDDLNNPVKQSIVIGKTSLTGNTIMDQSKNKMIGYVVFVLIILVGIFFIIRMGYGQENSKGLEE